MAQQHLAPATGFRRTMTSALERERDAAHDHLQDCRLAATQARRGYLRALRGGNGPEILAAFQMLRGAVLDVVASETVFRHEVHRLRLWCSAGHPN